MPGLFIIVCLFVCLFVGFAAGTLPQISSACAVYLTQTSFAAIVGASSMIEKETKVSGCRGYS